MSRHALLLSSSHLFSLLLGAYLHSALVSGDLQELAQLRSLRRAARMKRVKAGAAALLVFGAAWRLRRR